MKSAGNLLTITALLAVTAAPSPASEMPADPVDWDRCVTCSPETGEAVIDPGCFFEMLIARYRCLEAYEDVARVIRVTERSGRRPMRVETMIGCEIQDGRLLVQTPGSQIRRTVGLDVHFRSSPALEQTELDYNMWLAPHMALRFADEPRRQFRPHANKELQPTEAESVTIDEKPMVHLQLQSDEGPPSAEEAHFDLYVNPDSMLIERITGQERLPGGTSYETTLEITPISAEDAAGDRPPAEPEAQTAEAVPPQPPAEPGRPVDAGPQVAPEQTGRSAAPPPDDPPAREAGETTPSTSPPPQDPPRGRGNELGRSSEANLKPPAKAHETKSPPEGVESEDRGSTAEHDDDSRCSDPPKPGQSRSPGNTSNRFAL